MPSFSQALIAMLQLSPAIVANRRSASCHSLTLFTSDQRVLQMMGPVALCSRPARPTGPGKLPHAILSPANLGNRRIASADLVALCFQHLVALYPQPSQPSRLIGPMRAAICVFLTSAIAMLQMMATMHHEYAQRWTIGCRCWCRIRNSMHGHLGQQAPSKMPSLTAPVKMLN